MQQFLTGQTAQTNALNAIASRPQKEFQETKPLEYADMLARRNQIGAERAMLNEALKQRETFGYGLANALASMPAQQGAGSWLGDFARGFGSAFNARANAAIDRAKQDYEAAQADLATALAFDKAMGEQQTMDYRAVPYATGKTGATTGGGDSGTTFAGVRGSNFGRSVGYDPVENVPDFGYATRAALDEEQLGVLKYLPGAQATAKGISKDDTRAHLQTLHSGISDNILTGKVLDFVSNAGGVRVADTPAEQEFIFGPIRNYQKMDPVELKEALRQSRNNFVAAGLNAGSPFSPEQLKEIFNSAFSVPTYLQTDKMYNIQDKTVEQTKSGASVADWDNDDWWANYK